MFPQAPCIVCIAETSEREIILGPLLQSIIQGMLDLEIDILHFQDDVHLYFLWL